LTAAAVLKVPFNAAFFWSLTLSFFSSLPATDRFEELLPIDALLLCSPTLPCDGLASFDGDVVGEVPSIDVAVGGTTAPFFEPPLSEGFEPPLDVFSSLDLSRDRDGVLVSSGGDLFFGFGGAASSFFSWGLTGTGFGGVFSFLAVNLATFSATGTAEVVIRPSVLLFTAGETLERGFAADYGNKEGKKIKHATRKNLVSLN
jgi:hypothetical protein